MIFSNNRDTEKTDLLKTVLVKFKTELCCVFFFSLIVNLLTLTPTLYMMQIYDRVLLSQNLYTLLFLSLIFLVFFLLMAFAERIRSKVLVLLGNKIEVKLTQPVFESSLQLYLKDKSVEPSVLLRSLVEFKQFIAGALLVAFFDLVWSPLYIIVAFLLHPVLGAVCVAIVLIQLFLLMLNHRRGHSNKQQIVDVENEHKRFTYLNLSSVLPIHAMGFQAYFAKQWLQFKSNIAVQQRQQDIQAQRSQFVLKYFRYCTQTISLGAGAWLVVHGQISVGSMIAANVIVAKAIAPLDQMSQLWPQWLSFKHANAQLSHVLRQTDLEHNAIDFSESQLLQKLSVVDFGAQYLPQQAILKQLNFTLNAGSVVAIVGASGSGKTTLVKALMGLVPNTTGQIQINSKLQNLQTLNGFAQQTGYLPQDFQLFDGTVAENIARFAEIESESVTQAAQMAGIHEWVLRLPKGYETPIGQQGQFLSGGQKQQLGLARAIYNNSQFVVLDEPNSNLDEMGERSLHQTILHLKQRHALTLVISHRPQILNTVDQILWLENGSIKAFGSASEVWPLFNAAD